MLLNYQLKDLDEKAEYVLIPLNRVVLLNKLRRKGGGRLWSLNPLESGRVVKWSQFLYSPIQGSLNPLESGRVVKSKTAAEKKRWKEVLIPLNRVVLLNF